MVAITPDEVVSIANEYGHEIIADKINQITEEELEGAAGGALSRVTGNRRTNGYGCLYTPSAEGCWEVQAGSASWNWVSLLTPNPCIDRVFIASITPKAHHK